MLQEAPKPIIVEVTDTTILNNYAALVLICGGSSSGQYGTGYGYGYNNEVFGNFSSSSFQTSGSCSLKVLKDGKYRVHTVTTARGASPTYGLSIAGVSYSVNGTYQLDIVANSTITIAIRNQSSTSSSVISLDITKIE